MQRLTNPLPLFIGFGSFLESGFVYVGEAGTDPTEEANQLALYLDADLSTPIAQPLRTLSGMVVSGANAVQVWMAEDDYSLAVHDANDTQVFYVQSAAEATASYQPLSSTLSLLAALTTTAFGRSLLALADVDALKTALAYPAALPLIGGTVTGGIVRSGAGNHPYYADSDFAGGRIFITAAGEADPTSQPGDIWIQTS